MIKFIYGIKMNMTIEHYLGTIVSLVLILIWFSIYIIPQQTIVIIERFGKFNRIAQSGIHFIIPGIENKKILNWNYTTADYYNNNNNIKKYISWTNIPTNIISLDLPAISCVSKDIIAISVDVATRILITDPVKAAYEMTNPLEIIQDIFVSEIKNICRANNVDIIITASIDVKSIQNTVNEKISKYGILCDTVTLQEIKIPAKLQENMQNKYVCKNEIDTQLLLNEHNHKLNMIKLEQESIKKQLEDQIKKEELDRTIARDIMSYDNEMTKLRKKNLQLILKLKDLQSMKLSSENIVDIQSNDSLHESIQNTNIHTLYLGKHSIDNLAKN